MKINDEGTSNAAHWYERAMKAEARLAEAEALLRESFDWVGREPVPFDVPRVLTLRKCINAHLAREEKP